MVIKLYNNLSENNIINKTITQVGNDITAAIKGDISVETPNLIFTYPGSLPNVNYFYISEFSRYYYITDIIDKTGGRYELRGKTDVLESFKSQILGLSCIIDKTENNALSNMYLNDGSFVSMEKEYITSKNFPQGFLDDGEFILITAGGIAAS